jgi:hypothetical protein
VALHMISYIPTPRFRTRTFDRKFRTDRTGQENRKGRKKDCKDKRAKKERSGQGCYDWTALTGLPGQNKNKNKNKNIYFQLSTQGHDQLGSTG